ncbi:LTA synthase family protein [Streptococcus bovimastitidis]|uniref:LTA synthase family protein n=1 Tax=Streptococcus bovimastitidis TaxID=1856638 RepID=UPI0013F4E4DA|nr:LTA synthase family protein [Streptococcus bovimastitidis]
MTLRLNDPTFMWQEFTDFWQYNSLKWIGLILCFAFGLKFLTNRISFFKKVSLSNTSLLQNVSLGQTFTLLTLTSPLFLERLSENTLLPVSELRVPNLNHNVWQYTLTFYFLSTIVTLLIAHMIEDFRQNQSGISSLLSTSIIFAIISNYFIQVGITDKGSHYHYFIAPGATILQIILLTLLFIIPYLIVNRYIPATLLNLILAASFSLINALKFEARQEPFIVSDLIWIKDIQFFKDYISFKALISIVILLALISLILKFTYKKLLWSPLFKTITSQVSFIIIFFSLFFSGANFIKKHANSPFPAGIPVLSSVYNFYDVNWLGINANARFQSLSYVWLKSLTVDKMKMPKGYSHQKIEEIYLKYYDLSQTINKNRKSNIDDQTIIYVLSESLANPLHLDGIESSTNPLENIDQLKKDTTSGMMISDGYGGGTANMEFQSITGLNMTSFSSNVTVLNSEIFPNMDYVPSISHFYKPQNRIVIHLDNAHNYNRTAVYGKLNFNKFIAKDGSADNPKSIKPYGQYPSDQSTYQNIINQLDDKENKFIYAITMQNHGPYNANGASASYAIKGENFSEVENRRLQDYTNRLAETDRATSDFFEKLSQMKKPITVVFYGDHLPGLYPNSFFKTSDNRKKATDYFIWSNQENFEKQNFPTVRSNDFPALLFENTKSKLSPYYALLSKNLPSEDFIIDKKAAEDLKYIQYDITVGKNHIKKHSDFFSIPTKD